MRGPRRLGLGALVLIGLASAVLLARGPWRAAKLNKVHISGRLSTEGKSSQSESPSLASAPNARPAPHADLALRQQFQGHLNHLVHLVDVEGAALLLYTEDPKYAEPLMFIKEHASECKEDIQKVCLERRGRYEPLGSRLRSLLLEEDRKELSSKIGDPLAPFLDPWKDNALQRLHVLAEVIQDKTQPIGLRYDALIAFSGQKTLSDSAAIGHALALVENVTEPLLRTGMYTWLLSDTDERSGVWRALLDKAILTLTEGTEPRGTTFEALDRLGLIFRSEEHQGPGAMAQPRVESAIISRLVKESQSLSPDKAIVGGITVALMRRSLIPSTEQIDLARVLLGSDKPSAVRSAAAALLLPDLAGKETDSSAQGFLIYTRPILLQALKNEKDSLVVGDMLFGLTRFKDPESLRLLEALAEERPDLGRKIKEYSPEKER